VLGASLTLVSRSVVGNRLAITALLFVALAAVVSECVPRLRTVWPGARRGLPFPWAAWLHRTATAFGWGVLIGCGLLSGISTPLLFAFIALALSTSSLVVTIVACTLYGLTRGLTLIAAMRWLPAYHLAPTVSGPSAVAATASEIAALRAVSSVIAIVVIVAIGVGKLTLLVLR
jgi:hypothetical protein